MLKTLLVIYLGINILTWILIIPWLIIYLQDKCYLKVTCYNQEDTDKTATTVIEPITTDNIHYSEYISGEDFMNIFSTLDSDKYEKSEEKFYYHFPMVESTYFDRHEKPEEKFYYQGKYLTKEEVIEKAHEVLRRNINY